MMELLAVFISALGLGAIGVDWLNRRDLSASVAKSVEEMNRVLGQVSEVHNKQTIELAALSERITQVDMKTSMMGRSPFGKQ
jgi:hypothetical protein